MTWDIAKTAIDVVIKNCIGRTDSTHLGFHGGGEPLLEKNMDLIKRTVEYFKKETRKYNLKSRISSATNGVISLKNLEWIIKNFDNLNISLDGTMDIQDAQRPKANGDSSFYSVLNTISFLENNKFNYGIRTTITKQSVSKMPEIIQFLHVISPSLKSFHLEPLAECGRCKTTKLESPSPKDFIKYMLQAREISDKLEIEIYYSGSKLEKINYSFCGAAGRNFFVTPSGNVTTCLEVCREEDNRAKIFLIGKYDPDKKEFIFDEQKIKKLRKRVVQDIPHCSDCFAKYNCSGDCLAKVYSIAKDLNGTNKNPRCSINRTLLYDEIQKKLNS